ncbi:GmrSD restriction endonuclease domain-containing protein [Candidatus Viridilinea mediisalina]|uniref:GmrSD restriction endonucleases C-terminal domain-containing protein n=1 Tax=Candidatus Viridilinea mediisalina TaxID=2024553 RepID=A0A2A6RE65_9CHLR|nr:hypothetical protein CJ255_19540 [Candidatus Viridilinea mediisalina]
MPESSAPDDTTMLLIGNIGNLILLDAQTNNRELTQMSFEHKKAHLIKINYPIDEYIKKQNT